MAYDDGGDIGGLGIIGSWVDETGNGNSIVRAKPNGMDYVTVIVQRPTGATIEYAQYYLIGCQVGGFNSNFPCYIIVRQQKVTVNNGYILGDKSGVWAAVSGCVMKSSGTENNYTLAEINSSTITIKPIVRSGGSPQPTPTPPSKPTNLNIGGASEKWIYYTNSFTLSWSGSSNASGYNIYFDGNKKISTSYTSHTFNGLSMSDIGTHSITVRAYNIDYSSEQSNTVTLYVCGEVLLKDGMNTSTLYNQGNTWKIEYNLSSYTPTKQGYIFDGWYTQPTGGTQVTGTIQLKNYGSVTYYAHWRSGAAQEFTITFDDNGGTGGPGTRQTTNQKLVIPDRLPTKGGTSGGSSGGSSGTPTPGTNGATCLGWSLTKDGPLAYTVGQTVTFNANTRLYAVWASDKTVTYKGTGSDSGLPPAPQSAGYNVTIKISGNTGNLKKTGYEFNTWKKEGGTDIYSFGQNYTGSASLSLVPNWTGKVYKITYSGLGSPIEATIRFGDRFVFPAAPSKQGYDFTGWQLNDTIYQPGDVITSWNIASGVTITATWKKQTSWRMIIPWIYIEE